MLNIHNWLNGYIKEFLLKRWPSENRFYNFHCEYRTRQTSRYIQIGTSLDSHDVHYEYHISSDWKGYVELHFEGEYLKPKYRHFKKYLWQKTKDYSNLVWLNWAEQSNNRCRLNQQIETLEELMDGIKIISDIFDPLLLMAEKVNPIVTIVSLKDEKYIGHNSLGEIEGEEVSFINECSIEKLFGVNLAIPNYQRDYCWEDKQILDLWNNLGAINDKYHLGTIILHKDGDIYNVIDGQQRLTTLTLILYALGYRGKLPLWCQNVSTETSLMHIANAKSIVVELAQNNHNARLKDNIIDNLIFSILIVNSNNLDLAYTFFSNQNSRGVRLTDYDILKAHHLRYIYDNHQSEHLAKRWNILSHELVNDRNILATVLGIHLYRLRKWKRGYPLETYRSRYVKDEFSAAPIMDGIPPFGEKFDFYEKIQGGAHFFEYTEQFVDKYKDFERLLQVKLLHNCLDGESHVLYADVIETLLFGYYLKFGRSYLSEALFCISGIMAQHRYEKSRINLDKVCEYAQNSEIVMMIDQASSPTFFLAEALARVKKTSPDSEDYDIRMRFRGRLVLLFRKLRDSKEEMVKITDKTIQIKIENEYE